MNVNISPWKPGDKGYACMPVFRNVPNPNREDWKLVKCPKCGADCWETDLCREVKAQGVPALCTECALRVGLTGGETK